LSFNIYLYNFVTGRPFTLYKLKKTDMKTATENLENDHVHILRLTEVMLRMAAIGSPDPAHVESVINIIRNFADGIHHAKEENLLFPKLAEKGLSPYQGPVAVMLHEHVEGRNYVKGMSENLGLYKNGKEDAATGIALNMEGYASLLQNHIAKEDNILFRMADNVLSLKEQSDLMTDFEKVESEQEEGTKPADYIFRINELAAIYLK
jgi:hemerythrin-like domain-containing protein